MRAGPSTHPAPKLDCRASRQNCANIDTPDTNWQPNVWEENYQDQRSLALVRLLPGEAKRAAPRGTSSPARAVVVAMAAQALARVTLEEDELANASGLRAALLKTSDCVVETDTPIYSVVHVAVTPARTVRLVAHGTCEKGLVLELRNTAYPPLLLAKILAAADAAAAAEAANGGGRAAASCLLYTSPSPRDATLSRMPSSA